MSKFQYTHFGDEVPKEVEKEYNRMELMRMDYPFEYQLIRDYYLSEKAVSMMYLAKKYAVSPKKVEYRINKAKRLLREYIIAHENEE